MTSRVGVVAILVGLAAFAFVVFVVPSLRHRGARRIHVAFHHVGGLREGAPLVVGGREVGVVESMVTAQDGVEAIVAIDPEPASMISRGGDVFISSRGPLGDKYLELGPAPEPDLPYTEGERVVGRDPPQMDRVMNRTWDNLQLTKAFVDQLRPAWVPFAAQLVALQANIEASIPADLRGGELALQLSALAADARQLRDGALGGQAGLDHIDRVLTETRALIGETRARIVAMQTAARALMANVDGLGAKLGPKGTLTMTLAKIDIAIERAKAAIDKIDPLLANVQAIQDRIDKGEGTLGRLMKDPEFPEDAKDLGRILKREPWKIIARPPD